MNPNLQRIEATLSQISPQIDAQRAVLNRRTGSAKGSISFTVSTPATTLAATPAATLATAQAMAQASAQASESTAETALASGPTTKLDLPAFAPLTTAAAIAPALSPNLAAPRVTPPKPSPKSAPTIAPTVNAGKPVAATVNEDKTGAIARPITPSITVLDAPPQSPGIISPSASSTSARPFPKRDSAAQPFEIPKFKLPDFSSSRHVTNPEFVLGLLKELETIVSVWHKDLQRVRLAIQDLYLEGPVIDGWLESQSHEPAYSGAATLRHAEIDRLMEYVEEICRQPTTATENSSPQSISPPKAARTDYRLCGLDADGQLWSRPCPAEQVPNVGLAIARYQKLRQLLGQQRDLEGQLNTFAQSLITFHRDIATAS